MKGRSASSFKLHLKAAAAMTLALSGAYGSGAFAQTGDVAAAAQNPVTDVVVVTGSRIRRKELSSTSPIAVTTRETIKLQQAATVEDFSVKVPALSGGIRDTASGSDSYGANVLELRNLGQDRTLVLIDGTRAVPFSFRNSVDVSAIPAGLLKSVDVLTGGAAAVYGADAVAGVVNFRLNDDFTGLELTGGYHTSKGGGNQSNVALTLGGSVNDRGHVVIYADYTDRTILRAGERAWAAQPSATVAPAGGNFTDVASGRTFSFDANNAFTTTPQTSNFSGLYPLVDPLKRLNLSTLFKYTLFGDTELYGRALYTNVRTVDATQAGSTPASVDEDVTINQSNPFLTSQIASQLTFVGGKALVHVNRSLFELGLTEGQTQRNTLQVMTGLRGSVTNAIKWDGYVQTGRVNELTTVVGDGLYADTSGASYFSQIVNTCNIFGSGSSCLKSLGSPIALNNRTRTQDVAALTFSGDSSEFFSLPAGPLGFAVGAEYRRETGKITQDTVLIDGNNYNQGTQEPLDATIQSRELYGEALVPVLKNFPFAKSLNLEFAYRESNYSRFGKHDTRKIGLNWLVNSQLRFRGSAQTVIRAPNMGEFAGAIEYIPLSKLVTVARLRPRYAGDPCALGTGNAAQCARFGAPAVGSYDSLSAANLTGKYYYGGNPNIMPETGNTKTFGFVLTPNAIKKLSVTVDYYDITITNAVGQIQPIDALTSCYITNPTANNPLCAAVTRDPTTGRIKDAYPIDRNLSLISQNGFDVGIAYSMPVPHWLPGNNLSFAYQGNIVNSYKIQRNEVLPIVECKGTYGSACSSDSTTLVQPAYRHLASVGWTMDAASAQVSWQRIGKVRDSSLGSTDVIKPVDYIDLNTSYELNDRVKISARIQNLLDKDPPYARKAGSYNTYPDTYDVLGRTFGVSVTYRQ